MRRKRCAIDWEKPRNIAYITINKKSSDKKLSNFEGKTSIMINLNILIGLNSKNLMNKSIKK